MILIVYYLFRTILFTYKRISFETIQIVQVAQIGSYNQ